MYVFFGCLALFKVHLSKFDSKLIAFIIIYKIMCVMCLLFKISNAEHPLYGTLITFLITGMMVLFFSHIRLWKNSR